MDARLLRIAARIVTKAGRKLPADAALRAELKNQRALTRRDATVVSRAVFAFYRWLCWVDTLPSLERQIEEAVLLSIQFARDEAAFSTDDLLARAIPAWVKEFITFSGEWVRSLQREPRLWLRARRGHARELVKKLGCARTLTFPDAVVYEGEEDLFHREEFHRGEFEIQDIASQAVGLLCDPRPGETWWDACAGEGGKTLHLCDLMENRGRVWASDRAEWRLQKLKRRAARAAAFNYRAVRWDGGQQLPTRTKFDGVLVDAPCTGIGAWGRNPHARWTTRPEEVGEMAKVQAELLTRAATAVKPGGKLIYAVCTMTEGETIGVTTAFSQSSGNFEPLSLANPFVPADPPTTRLLFWPQTTGGNGMFVAAWRRAILPGALALLVALAPAISQGADLIVADKGKSRYRIVIPADAIPSERHAAGELQRYLEKISGAKLPIVTDAEPAASREILLGANARARKLKDRLDVEKLGGDGFLLRTEGSRLIIAGGRPRGTLYGVYALLEEKLGVRWFTPEIEVVSVLNRVRVPPLNETQVPALEYREVFWTEMTRDADFAARHRLNGNHYRLTEKQGGPAVVYFPFVHSFDALIPRELYKDHPEYFPLIDGRRKDGYVQRCLSNPDVLRIAIDRVRQWIKEHPDATIISVSQNDTFNYCQCPDCKSLDDAEGSPAASMIRFVNAVAEAVEKDYPDIRIDTLAYQYTRKPPKTLRPRRNVIVRLCSIECCFAHPLEACGSEENRRFRDDLLAWQPVAPRLYVWDYTPNFANYQQPFPNFESLQPNVRFFVSHGVKGLFEQGNYSSGGNGEMGPLRAYVLAKLLWNPDTSVRRHIDEFLGACYGNAADKIREYLELLQSQVRERTVHAHIFDRPTAAYLNDEFIERADRIFEVAERVTDSDTVRFRVQVAHLPVQYVKLATDRVTGNERADLLRRFLGVARKAGVSNISEGMTLDQWARRMGVD